MSEGPSLARWLLILAFGGTMAVAVGSWVASCMAWASSQPGGGETERERKEEAVFLL